VARPHPGSLDSAHPCQPCSIHPVRCTQLKPSAACRRILVQTGSILGVSARQKARELFKPAGPGEAPSHAGSERNSRIPSPRAPSPGMKGKIDCGRPWALTDRWWDKGPVLTHAACRLACLITAMGNAPSFEAEPPPPPRKTPHKLSKPRVGNHANTTAGLLSSNGFAFSSSARLSHSPAAAVSGRRELPVRPVGGAPRAPTSDNPQRPPPKSTRRKTTQSNTKTTARSQSVVVYSDPEPTGPPPGAPPRSITEGLAPPNPAGGVTTVVAPHFTPDENYRPTPPRKDTFLLPRKSLFRSKSSRGLSERKLFRASTGLLTPRSTDCAESGRANSMTFDMGVSQYYSLQTDGWVSSSRRSLSPQPLPVFFAC
jgi:hypothetical protein